MPNYIRVDLIGYQDKSSMFIQTLYSDLDDKAAKPILDVPISLIKNLDSVSVSITLIENRPNYQPGKCKNWINKICQKKNAT